MPTNCYECNAPLRGAICIVCNPKYDAGEVWLALCAHGIKSPGVGTILLSYTEVEKALAALNAGKTFV